MAARRRRTPQLAVYVACGVLAVSWFLWLRPVALGGAASYVVVQGASMEPTYHDGDLVIVREEDRYDEGEVIAFRAGGRFEDRTRIIHRIVGTTDDAFLTQGDNRDRLDPWQPTDDDVIGRAVFHVPHLGDVAGAAGRPQVLAALGGAAVMAGGRRRRRRRMTLPTGGDHGPVLPRPTPRAGALAAAPRWLRHTEPRWAFLGLVATALLLVPLLALTWSALQADDSEVRSRPYGVLDLGIGIDYRLSGEPSAVYPNGTVATNRLVDGSVVPAATLYSRLLDRLEVSLAFRAGSEGAEDLAGTYGVDVVLAMPEGWSTTLVTVDPTPFDAVATELVAVDLADAATKVDQVVALTGVGGGEYTVTVTPRLQLEGEAEGEPVQESLAPVVTFAVDDGVITVAPVQEASAHRELSRQVRASRDYELGPFSLSTQSARGVLAGTALVLLGALGICALVLFGGLGLGESERIAARYRSQIVDVAAATGPPGPVVMVSAIDELARLAKVEQSVILHEDLGDGGHRYRVFLGAVTYEYETAPDHGARAAGPGPTTDRTGT
jgi:signal peptidase I